MNVRLCYASQRNEKNEDLLQDLRDILTEARDFNDLNGICGVLYYADNAFFQCLEGEPYRVCRRVNILRDYPDDKTKLYPRN
ncbi:MAG: BLUF domain-containing protein [Acinetobacter baumannii]|nr:BLUF domain-containing protein [Acinetobacter baumannii]